MKIPTRRKPGQFLRRSLKLTETQVETILTCGGSDTQTAKVFGISQVMVTRIRAGGAWRHVYERVVLGRQVEVITRAARPFEECYIPEPNSGCWLWLGSLNKDGYGCSYPNIRAHRESYVLHKGPIQDGMCVCHKCDTPSCVNPDHLFLGTAYENNLDKVRKGRCPKGEQKPAAKLTDNAVRSIRIDKRTNSEIARELGVTPRVIGLVRRGLAWKHVA
jgi:hypothetical protein